MSKVLSAVAWPYANGPRHIGHVAGFGVPSDVFSRYMRMAGHDVLMVSGTDEHGTPILVAGRQGRGERRASSPTPTTGSSSRTSPTSGCSYDLFTRTTTRNHYAVAQEMFTSVHANGYMVEQTTHGRDLAVDRAHPARPLHRGHLPDLRLRRGPRRPVRQLRQPARPDRPDRPAQQDQRRDAGVRRDPALLPRPARAGRRPRGVARRARGVGHLAAQRHQVQPEHPRGDPPAGDDPRHRLGHPGAARRLARAADQAALRVVRRGHRLPVGVDRVGPPHRRPRALARVVERPRGPVLLLHGQGQHHLPLPDLAGRAARLRRPGRQGRRRRARTACCNLPTEVVSSRVPHDGGPSSSPPAAAYVIYVRDVLARYRPDALRYFICAAGPENQDSRLHLGASSSSATTASSSPAGATSSTAPRR